MRMDRQTDITKLPVTFYSFANAPNNEILISALIMCRHTKDQELDFVQMLIFMYFLIFVSMILSLYCILGPNY
jgi:hypothetical protein